jgi:tetratricopeptide (TPR) repeat protein
MRFTLAVAIPLAVSAVSAQPPDKKNDPKSLVGQVVLLKESALNASLDPPPAGPVPRSAAIYGPWYVAREEKDGWVRIRADTGTVYWVERDAVVPLAEAVAFFTAERTKTPLRMHVYNARGWAHFLLGEYAKAADDFDEYVTLTASPPEGVRVSVAQEADALASRGLARAEAGRLDRALKDLEDALAKQPDAAVARLNRGYVYELKGDYGKALADYGVAEGRGLTLAVNNAAWVWATCPDAKFRDAKKAVELATKACESTGNEDGMYLDTLAAAYAEAGRFADAVKAQEKALADPAYAKRYGDGGRDRFKLYKQGKPFRTEPVKK